MVSALLMPRGRVRRAGAGVRAVRGGTAPTPILDLGHPRVLDAVRSIGAAPREGEGPGGKAASLRRAHRWISAEVRPVYSVEETRPVSEVLRRGRGSCSQRMAVLEAVARAWGVPTRVRGLVVDGVFWYPRFPRLRRIVPGQVVLAWPEFRIDGLPESRRTASPWLPVSELFAGAAGRAGGGFTNAGAETLFEALSRTAVDWDGAAACPASDGTCDLSARLLVDLGRFDSRDELFARYGQTLCATARLLAEPVLGRRGAGFR
ncbi:transglutaminase-like domain-containing protein [Streptacidiphilus sp. ASG 303]|uniref:transglutaminase-like domain-containing protein n=1 Tax=Streptacidiphilus sp. ASG 303 TaxID=2896847 RepID=UPI001E3D8336|nr:transglutaminase-like domain-containing protein [Streptacidiphilus sp. ASG 303]MCD0484766.1 transglutaminase-like domain-containing protein [Streptacidiphilus sp. ASG 303]